MFRTACAAIIATALIAAPSFAQEAQQAAAGAPVLTGKDLSAWKLKNEKANLWKIAGDATMNSAKPKELQISGEPSNTTGGVFVNDLKDGQHGSDLYTQREFGDCEVHVELMVPKGSNSGVYLMGRYEVQVLDSFGKKNPGMGDLGAIYSAAVPNAANYQPRPPGEWQSLDITFRAPRFDAAGKKTANAKFVSIKLNGKEIQKDVEVQKPTGGQLKNEEAPTGPLLFQGDHGAVAFRNLRVKELGN
jgi:hypothetical protein